MYGGRRPPPDIASARSLSMKNVLLTVALLALSLPAFPGNGNTTIEDFEDEVLTGGWTFNVTARERRVPTGGNPGAWLQNQFIVSFAPILASSGASEFTGDFRAKNVTRISVDARTDMAELSAAGRPFSLLLRDDKGTPFDPADDDYAYFTGPLVPQVGEGWQHYDFDVPSASTVPVPPGWSGGHGGDLENFRPGVDWNDVITNVTHVELWWQSPAFFAIIQHWSVGVDNVAIESGGALATPRNGTGANPTLLANLTSPAIGTTWSTRLDCAGFGAGLGFLLGFRAPSEGAIGPAGELLVDLTSKRIVSRIRGHSGGALDFDFAVPNDPALCGVVGYFQAACEGSQRSLRLTNAIDAIVGQE